MDAIDDHTRPVVLWNVYPDAAAFMGEQLKKFMTGYHRNLLRSQPHHIELLVEKNTIATIVEQVAGLYGMTMTSGRGYASVPPRYKLAKRFDASGKDKLILLIVSDFDPEGDSIAETYARSDARRLSYRNPSHQGRADAGANPRTPGIGRPQARQFTL